MIYWVVLAIAVLVIIISTVMTIRAIITEKAENKKRNHKKEKRSDRPVEQPKKKKVQKEADDYDLKKTDPKPRKKKESSPRRWKIVLEDMATGDVNSYIFYNSVGIGRTTQEVSFEKFMSIPDDKRISKVHCSITMIDDGLYVKDEGSKNHTYLNGKKIQKPVLLQKEDVISIGETDIEVVKIFREAEKN